MQSSNPPGLFQVQTSISSLFRFIGSWAFWSSHVTIDKRTSRRNSSAPKGEYVKKQLYQQIEYLSIRRWNKRDRIEELHYEKLKKKIKMSSEDTSDNPHENYNWNVALDLRIQKPTLSETTARRSFYYARFSLKCDDVTHQDAKPFKCLLCPKTFRTKSLLSLHSLVHSDRRDHLCTFCGKAFRRYFDLKRHLQSHENKREFKCKVCGKGFNTSSILNTHKHLVHQIVKKFKCPECKNSFETMLEVKRHSISHSQIKKFACPECGKLFKRNYEVRRHLIIHKDKKEF
jgi:uncharacterized Zn-finger protein